MIDMEVSHLTRAQLLAMLAPWIADPLTGAEIQLYVNDVTPGPSSVLADFTEATFTGYAPVTVTPPGDPDIVGTKIQIPLNQGFFQATADMTPIQTAYGYLVVDGSDLLAAGRFDEAVDFATAGDYASFAPMIEVPIS